MDNLLRSIGWNYTDSTSNEQTSLGSQSQDQRDVDSNSTTGISPNGVSVKHVTYQQAAEIPNSTNSQLFSNKLPLGSEQPELEPERFSESADGTWRNVGNNNEEDSVGRLSIRPDSVRNFEGGDSASSVSVNTPSLEAISNGAVVDSSIASATTHTTGALAEGRSSSAVVELAREEQLLQDGRSVLTPSDFIATFIIGSTDEKIQDSINRASLEQLLKFTTAFHQAVQYLFDSRNGIQLTDDAPYHRIGLIMECAIKRRQTISIANTIATEIQNRYSPPSKEVCDFLTSYRSTGKDNVDAGNVWSQLTGAFDTIKQTIPKGKNRLIDSKNFKAAAGLSAQEVRRFCLQHFQTVFTKQEQFDPHNDLYRQILNFIAAWIANPIQTPPTAERVRLHSSQPRQIQPAPRGQVLRDPNFLNQLGGFAESAVESVAYSSVGRAVGLKPPEETQAKANALQEQQTEIEMRGREIEEMLKDKKAMDDLKKRIPENQESAANALDVIFSSSQPGINSLIITRTEKIQKDIEKESDGMISRAGRWLFGCDSKDNQAEQKPWWSVMRLGRWLFRNDDDKERYRAGIEAARTHIENKYGPYAVRRFDDHFALRNRMGSPLTVGALKRFVANEERLFGKPRHLPPKESRRVVSIDLEKMPLSEFSKCLSAAAISEFQARYYKLEDINGENVLMRPEGMKIKDEEILFADFYQHYLQRSFVVAENVPKKIGGEDNFFGLLTTRGSAFWTSLFPGNNSKANQEIEEKLIAWIILKLPAGSKVLTEQKTREDIKILLRDNGRLTLEDVEHLTVRAQKLGQEHAGIMNTLYYDAGNFVATTVGTVAAATFVATDPSIARGAAKAAVLTAALYAAGDGNPGTKLAIAAGALWGAAHPQPVNVAANDLVSYGMRAAKYAAIGVAGIHFPPLLLALPFFKI